MNESHTQSSQSSDSIQLEILNGAFDYGDNNLYTGDYAIIDGNKHPYGNGTIKYNGGDTYSGFFHSGTAIIESHKQNKPKNDTPVLVFTSKKIEDQEHFLSKDQYRKNKCSANIIESHIVNDAKAVIKQLENCQTINNVHKAKIVFNHHGHIHHCKATDSKGGKPTNITFTTNDIDIDWLKAKKILKKIDTKSIKEVTISCNDCYGSTGDHFKSQAKDILENSSHLEKIIIRTGHKDRANICGVKMFGDGETNLTAFGIDQTGRRYKRERWVFNKNNHLNDDVDCDIQFEKEGSDRKKLPPSKMSNGAGMMR